MHAYVEFMLRLDLAAGIRCKLMTGPGEEKYSEPSSPSDLVTFNKTLTSEAMQY